VSLTEGATAPSFMGYAIEKKSVLNFLCDLVNLYSIHKKYTYLKLRLSKLKNKI